MRPAATCCAVPRPVGRQQLGHHDPLKLMRYREPKVGNTRHGAQEIVGEAAQVVVEMLSIGQYDSGMRTGTTQYSVTLRWARSKDREAWGVEVLSQAPALRRTDNSTAANGLF